MTSLCSSAQSKARLWLWLNPPAQSLWRPLLNAQPCCSTPVFNNFCSHSNLGLEEGDEVAKYSTVGISHMAIYTVVALGRWEVEGACDGKTLEEAETAVERSAQGSLLIFPCSRVLACNRRRGGYGRARAQDNKRGMIWCMLFT